MRKKIQQGKRQQNKVRTRVIIIFATTSMVVSIAAGLLVFMNINNLSKTRASGTGSEGGGNNLGNGDIISEFTWEKDPITLAILGSDAIKSGKDAHSMTGGRSSTNGLSPGANGKNIDLEIKANEIFKQDGIDISIDFRRNEPSGNFFTRGNFNFGMANGFLAINFSVENKLGKPETIKEITNYEIPFDPIFRTYRFIYTPTSGKAEIFVNSVIVWQKEVEKNTPLSWKNTENIFIGKDMNGGGLDRVIFDNLIIRSTSSVSPLAESLLNFMLEAKDGGVKIHWSTSINEKVDHFTIERSINGVDFTNLVNIQSRPDTSENDEYIFADRTPVSTPLVYFRLRQTFKNGKFITHSLSAIRFKSDKGFAIEKVSPVPFKKSCDISYFLPKSGRVWLQISDEEGRILKTENFEAPQGKNVHIYKDEKDLKAGTYTLSLIFDNKKESTKMVKL